MEPPLDFEFLVVPDVFALVGFSRGNSKAVGDVFSGVCFVGDDSSEVLGLVDSCEVFPSSVGGGGVACECEEFAFLFV